MAQTKSQIRNLSQYRGMSDEEFEEIWIKEYLKSQGPSEDFERRISHRLEEFEQDYDISDLKINDKAALRSLVQAIISLEDYEQIMFKLREDGISQGSIVALDRISRVMSGLRSDISKLQDDLNIKRKIRQSEEDISVLNYIEDLKQKARNFYRAKMQYVFCEECDMLIGTVWTLYPEEDNKMKFTCHRDLGEGKICGHVTTVSTKGMAENKGSNKPELMPEGMI